MSAKGVCCFFLGGGGVLWHLHEHFITAQTFLGLPMEDPDPPLDTPEGFWGLKTWPWKAQNLSGASGWHIIFPSGRGSPPLKMVSQRPMCFYHHSRTTVHVRSFQGSESFQATSKHPGKQLRFLKRTMVEKNGWNQRLES